MVCELIAHALTVLTLATILKLAIVLWEVAVQMLQRNMLNISIVSPWSIYHTLVLNRVGL